MLKTLESPLDCKDIQPVYPKGNHSLIFIGRTDAEAATPIFGHLMRRTNSLMLGKMKVGGEGDDKGWDGWMASLTQWTWVWVNSRSWWWTGRPGMMQSMGSQRVRQDWVTELNWTDRFLGLFSNLLDQNLGFGSSTLYCNKIFRIFSWLMKVESGDFISFLLFTAESPIPLKNAWSIAVSHKYLLSERKKKKS